MAGMIKLITLIPRKPGMSREAFIDYYENHHAPLTQALFPQAVKYVRNYPTSDNLHYAGAAISGAVPFDAVTEHWFADQAAYDAMMANFAADPEKFRVLSEDEARFCDRERMVMFLVEERPAAG
jgi:uncharacterized protein (TIGR02118 family)